MAEVAQYVFGCRCPRHAIFKTDLSWKAGSLWKEVDQPHYELACPNRDNGLSAIFRQAAMNGTTFCFRVSSYPWIYSLLWIEMLRKWSCFAVLAYIKVTCCLRESVWSLKPWCYIGGIMRCSNWGRTRTSLKALAGNTQPVTDQTLRDSERPGSGLRLGQISVSRAVLFSVFPSWGRHLCSRRHENASPREVIDAGVAGCRRTRRPVGCERMSVAGNHVIINWVRGYPHGSKVRGY